MQMDGNYPQDLQLLVDRVKIPGQAGNDGVVMADLIGHLDDLRTRLLSSVQTAFDKGEGDMSIVLDGKRKAFCSRFELDGMTFREPDEYLFSFNSPLGACPECGGLGKIIGISEDLVIPDKTKTIYDGAVACWRGDKMSWFPPGATV